MTIPNARMPEKATFPPKQLSGKWEKRHWLLVLAVACCALWWWSASLQEMPMLQKALAYLPTIGGAAFALEAMTKLAQ